MLAIGQKPMKQEILLLNKFNIKDEKDKVKELFNCTDSDIINIESSFNVNMKCLGQELMISNSLKLIVFKTTAMTYINCKNQWNK